MVRNKYAGKFIELKLNLIMKKMVQRFHGTTKTLIIYLLSIKIYLLSTFLLLYRTSSYIIQRYYANLGQPYAIKISKNKSKIHLSIIIKQ